MCFTGVCLIVRTIPFCEIILNFISYLYSCRGEWLVVRVAGGPDIRMNPLFL